MTILKNVKVLLYILFRGKKQLLCIKFYTPGKSHLNENKFTLHKPYAGQWRVSCMVEVFSTEEVYYF